MQLDFFNTIHARGATLDRYNSEATSQEAQVMKVFESGNKYTALAVTRITGMNQDSCKRAISNLKNKGKLVKLKEMKMEVHGKPNHLWVKVLGKDIS